MKRVPLIIICLAISLSMAGQSTGALIKFTETSHDFGKFREDAGPQTHSFEFVNTGNSDLLIQKVLASCGCTTPEWTKHPVKPGEKGSVSVTYDPRNRPNKFKKTATVYSNTNPAVAVLIIEGDVIPRELTVDEIYRWPVGDIRFKSNHMAFTNIEKGKKKIRVLEVINTSKNPVKIGFERVPAHVKLVAKPEVLKPGEKGMVEGTYDAALKNDWGYVNDLIRIVLDDEVQNNVYMVVSANLVEDFGSLSKEELANAPVFKAENLKYDFGDIAQHEKANVSFKFSNEGKSDLIIRKIRSSCGCTTVTPANTIIKPGESSVIEAVFDAGVRKGKQSKVITVITNDPKLSSVSLIVSGNVLEN